MDCTTFADDAGKYLDDSIEAAVKILVVGAHGVGKTTLVSAVSEIAPLRTEEQMRHAGAGIDRPLTRPKSTASVAMDFGRITLNQHLVLYVFGVPGQQRSWHQWEDLAQGALGAVALIDTRSLEDGFGVLGQLEDLDLPFTVAVNQFPGSPVHEPDELRTALDVLPGVPVDTIDARRKSSAVTALRSLITHLQSERTR